MSKYKKQFISSMEYFMEAIKERDIKTLRSYLSPKFGLVIDQLASDHTNKEKDVYETFINDHRIEISEYRVWQFENPDFDEDNWITLSEISFVVNGEQSSTRFMVCKWNEKNKIVRIVIR